MSTEAFYRDFPRRSIAADVHGILLRVASLEDTLKGKMKAWAEPGRRQSKRIKDLGDIARLIENHPHLWELLSADLQARLEPPDTRYRMRLVSIEKEWMDFTEGDEDNEDTQA